MSPALYDLAEGKQTMLTIERDQLALIDGQIANIFRRAAVRGGQVGNEVSKRLKLDCALGYQDNE